MRKTLIITVVMTVALALLVGRSGLRNTLASASKSSDPYKVGFILDGPLNDEGFDTAINIGMQEVTKTFGSKVSVNYKLNVPESPEATQVIDNLVLSGDQMIFAASYGYHTYMAEAAKKYRSVKFLQYESTEVASNLSESYIGIDQAWYLAGMAACALTKTNKLGFVGSFAIPSLLIQVNGFELGAQAVNPKAVTKVVWMNSWYNPDNETRLFTAWSPTMWTCLPTESMTRRSSRPVRASASRSSVTTRPEWRAMPRRNGSPQRCSCSARSTSPRSRRLSRARGTRPTSTAS
jgi:basic membrane lipoprotein Med (substrate-binding protein (PBP1-ABC) superfamily)